MKTNVKNVPKLRWIYILPAIMIVNIMANMDRSIISYALPGGMMKDLSMNATTSGFAAGIVAIGMMVTQIPGGIIGQAGKAKKLCTLSILIWGTISLLTGFIQNSIQFLILRFLLGVAEGVLSPAMLTLMAAWFPDRDGELNKANSVFMGVIPIASIIISPLSGLIISKYSWRGLFIITGIASLIASIIWIIMIAERPENAKWISDEEKNYIINSIKEQKEMARKISSNVKAKTPAAMLFKNKNVWLLIFINFCANIGQFGFVMWLPTMIKNIIKTGMVSVGVLSTIPYIFTLIGITVWSIITKRLKDRRLATAFPLLFWAIFLILGNYLSDNVILGLTMICVVAFFVQGIAPSFWTYFSLILPPEIEGTARGLAYMGGAGLGQFLGPYIVGIFMSIYGSTNAGMNVVAGFLFIAFLLSLLLPKNIGEAE